MCISHLVKYLTLSVPGSDVVDWLYHHVEGFTDRREARKYSSNLLKAGYIRHTVNKITFSEQCYYIFGDLGGSEFYFSNWHVCLSFPLSFRLAIKNSFGLFRLSTTLPLLHPSPLRHGRSIPARPRWFQWGL